MDPTFRPLRRRLLWITLVLGGGLVVLQATTTRGYVEDAGGRPVAEADVLLGDGAGVLGRTRTDGGGHFRFFHRPLDRGGHRVLICAPGHGAAVAPPAAGVVLRPTYELRPISLSAGFWTPQRLGWRHPTPETCPQDFESAPRPA